MKLVIITFMSCLFISGYGSEMPMQHGFILSVDDSFASHLVANGHHSYQTNIESELSITDAEELSFYQQRKKKGLGLTYFLFQAQRLDLPCLKTGDLLNGHIIESRLGDYDPENVIVKDASLLVTNILLNIVNPFFKGNSRMVDHKNCD
ncbi:hypothetical protein N9N67_09105 [Bacteriovoracaceae bacterium]|nr:hypothetical protein [Bacteriovoracaceae bacterium]